jgi:hypothetical protein
VPRILRGAGDRHQFRQAIAKPALVEERLRTPDRSVPRRHHLPSLPCISTTVRVVGDAAIVRFKFVGESQTGDKKNQSNLGILMVWQKQQGEWRLLARCSTKL